MPIVECREKKSYTLQFNGKNYWLKFFSVAPHSRSLFIQPFYNIPFINYCMNGISTGGAKKKSGTYPNFQFEQQQQQQQMRQ